ncbi:MAG TPA: CARDB domain-containing protein, partial [Candidatus Hydrogenedentes bacterium]|nr:CARDB domain-containing protein [Candidatus Hydrogenedentota bacterium]
MYVSRFRSLPYYGIIHSLSTLILVLLAASAFSQGTPDLYVVEIMAVPTVSSPGQNVDISWTVKNQGDGDAIEGWWDVVYWSTDNQWDDADSTIGSEYRSEPLGINASYTIAQQISVPAIPDGEYFIIVRTDDPNWSNSVSESDETNNVLIKQITVYVPDLTVTAINAPDIISTQEQQIELSW